MWKRSEVEQLTGLTRHAIQDLCNQNTAGDGLGFWRPAVSKPGYSRFDEGDLLAFFLVRQLTRAGFTLAEVEPAVFDLWEDDEAFEGRVARKAERLQADRARLAARGEAIDALEHAAHELPGDRLRVIVGEALGRSLRHAVARVAGELGADQEAAEKIGARLDEARCALVAVLSGEADEAVRARAERVGALLAAGEMRGRQRTARRLVQGLARRVAAPEGGPAVDLAELALSHVLAESENGVPIELVYGKGSFKLLSEAATARAAEIRASLQRKEG